jgi:acetyltransferase-like isoleucine patch superfamily enzyme
MKIIAKLLNKIIWYKNAFWCKCQKSLFASCGKNVWVGHNCDFIYENIHVGDNVAIGNYASFIASIAKIHIGNNVMFGPNVTIRGGTHRIDVIGKNMMDITEKSPENDQDVIIEDDVWIAANVTILKGVRVGKGSVVGAGSLVTKSIPPYTIYTGSPDIKIRPRFSEFEVNEHERLLKKSV